MYIECLLWVKYYSILSSSVLCHLILMYQRVSPRYSFPVSSFQMRKQSPIQVDTDSKWHDLMLHRPPQVFYQPLY